MMLEAHKSLSERFIEVEKKNKFEETKLDVYKNLMDKEAGFISSQIGKCALYFLPDSILFPSIIIALNAKNPWTESCSVQFYYWLSLSDFYHKLPDILCCITNLQKSIETSTKMPFVLVETICLNPS